MKNRLKLHNYLLNKGYEFISNKILSNKILSNNIDKSFYKNGLTIQFLNDKRVIIKDSYDNRRYNFEPNDNNGLIINFITQIENFTNKIIF